MFLTTRLLSISKYSSGIVRFLGLLLAIFALVGGVYITNIKIPALITVGLAMPAIGFALITIVVYLVQTEGHVAHGRIRFTLLMSFQLVISLSILTLIHYFSGSDEQEQNASIDLLLLVSAESMLVFFIIFYFLLIYLNKFPIFSPASPSIFMGMFIPAALNLTAFVTRLSIGYCLTSMVGIFITTVFFSHTFFLYRKLFVSPFDRKSIVDSIKVGWVFVDQNEIIMDVNQAASIILGQPVDQLIGQSGETLMGNWNILFPASLFSEKELQASINHEGRWSYFHVRSLPVLQDGEFIGRIMLWNDVTERRQGDDIRKRTLDTTLGLLHSISSAASHSTDIRSFLETVIFQIVSSFNCTIGFIFMREFEFIGEEKAQLELVGTYSVVDLPETEQIAQSLSAPLASLASQQEIIIMKNSGFSSHSETFDPQEGMDELVLCPIIIEAQMQGALVLFRPDISPFLPDEITRLEMLTNELSVLIYVEQQRDGHAAMAERKKLVRVLHDTVTQQLYGLLNFTEVARTQLDSGTITGVSATLEKLNEAGRQALKEMRMFLYSLQPVNVAKIGLVTAINQRLEAVESRASVKTKLIIGQDVKLTLKQEVGLYEVALESLNNILRHAYAKNVTVTLKQFSKNIQLEIEDDGRGFDVEIRKNSGGMGLKNMRESAKQIHAKISIHSIPGTGTRVKIVLPRAQVSKMDK